MSKEKDEKDHQEDEQLYLPQLAPGNEDQFEDIEQARNWIRVRYTKFDSAGNQINRLTGTYVSGSQYPSSHFTCSVSTTSITVGSMREGLQSNARWVHGVTCTLTSNIFSIFATIRRDGGETSERVRVDSTPFRATWGTPSYDDSTRILTCTIQFNERIPWINAGYFDIVDNGFDVRNIFRARSITTTDPSASTPPYAANTSFTLTFTITEGTRIANLFIRLRPLVMSRYAPNRGGAPGNVAPVNASYSPVFGIGPPAAIATATWSNVSAARTLTADLTFTGTNVAGVDPADFEIINSSATVQSGWSISIPESTFTDGTARTITATPSAQVNASFRIRLKALSVNSDIGSNNAPLTAVTSTAAAVDSRILTTSFNTVSALPSFCATSGTRGQVTQTFTFNYAVTGLVSTDFAIINITQAAETLVSGWTITLTGTTSGNLAGRAYTLTITPPSNTNGIFRIRLNQSSLNFAHLSFPALNIHSPQINVDNRLLVPGVGGDEVAMFWSNLTGGTSLSGRLTVTGQSISSLGASDFEVIFASSGTTESNFTISLDPSGTSVNAGSYVMVTATRTSTLRTETNYRLRLKQDSVTANSMDAPSVNVDSNDIYFNSYTVWESISYCQTDNELSAIMRFGALVRGIAATDFGVLDQTDTPQTDWTVTIEPAGTTSRTLGQALRVKAAAPSNVTGIFRLRLNARSVRTGAATSNNHPTQDVISNEVSVNNISVPAVTDQVSEAFWSDLTGGTNLTGRINFVGKDVSNIAASDFDVIFASTRARESRFTITLDPSGTTATAGSYVTVTATRTGALRTETDYRLRLKQSSIRSTGSMSDDTPAVNIDSNSIHFNSYTIWGTASYCETDNELSAVLSFGALIRGISAADFDVIDQTDTAQTDWTMAIEPAGTTNRNLGQTITVNATAPSNVSGIFRLRLKERTMRTGAASTDNHPTQDVLTNEVSVNNITIPMIPDIPEDVSEAFWTDLTGGTSLSGRIHFVGKDVSNIAASDFEAIFASSGTMEPQFTISLDPSGTTATAGSYITVTATRTSQLRNEANYKLRLKESSIRSTGSTEDDTPAVNIDSNPIYFNSYTVWGTASYCETDNEFSAVMTFGALVRNIAAADFDVIDQTDTAQPDWTITIDPTGTTSRTLSQTLTVKAAAPVNATGVFRLRLKARTMRTGAATTNNHPTQDVLTNPVRIGNISTITPTVDRSQAFWSNLVGGPTLTGDLTFAGTGVTGIDATDFQVHLALTGIRDPDFTITVSQASAAQGQSVTVTATPGGSYSRDSDYQLRLTAQSMMMTGSTENDFPIGTIDSNNIHLNTIIIWGDSEGGTSISCPLTFRSDIINLGTDDFEVIDQTDTVQDTWTISFNPSAVTTRDIGEQLTVTGTPPSDELVSDVYRLRMKALSVAFEGSSNDTIPTQTFNSPSARVNNLETDLTLPAPYVIATVPASTAMNADPFGTLQTPTNNPNRVITLTITSYVDRVETNIDNLRATDFIITSDAGRLTATLT